MNYQRIHDLIISRGRDRTPEDGVYYEKHHVIPKCEGGSENGEKVSLTVKEHRLIHLLRYKLTGNHQHIGAVTLLSGDRINHQLAASLVADSKRREFEQTDPEAYSEWTSERSRKAIKTWSTRDPEGYRKAQSDRLKKSCRVYGKRYPGIMDAADDLGVHYQTIRRWIRENRNGAKLCH